MPTFSSFTSGRSYPVGGLINIGFSITLITKIASVTITVAEMASFSAPTIQDNPTGWGPCSMPEIFKDMPYQPFAKGDRLGKVADWTGATYQDRRYTNK